VLDARPRKLRVLKAVASGDTVALECEGVFPTGFLPACVFLVFDGQGRVKQDHTYAPDPAGTTARSRRSGTLRRAYGRTA
jgi:hypothetical protein